MELYSADTIGEHFDPCINKLFKNAALVDLIRTYLFILTVEVRRDVNWKTENPLLVNHAYLLKNR